jgi:hypothetical protein
LLQEKKIIKVQAFWRGHRVRKMFLSLFHQPQPPFGVVRNFAHHLDFSADDYRRDLQLQVKQMIVSIYFCLSYNCMFVTEQEWKDVLFCISHWPLCSFIAGTNYSEANHTAQKNFFFVLCQIFIISKTV